MKRLRIVLCFILIFNIAFISISCSSSNNDDETSENEINDVYITDLYVGYEYDIYPSCEFDYAIDDEFIIHVSEIKVTVTAINEINEGDTIDSTFNRFTYKVYAVCSTDYEYDGTLILFLTMNGFSWDLSETTNENGNIVFESEFSNSIVPQYIIFQSIIIK